MTLTARRACLTRTRTWLAIGGQYKVSKAGLIDFGYAHLFMKDASINLNGPPALTAAQTAGRGRLIGTFDDKVDILSVRVHALVLNPGSSPVRSHRRVISAAARRWPQPPAC